MARPIPEAPADPTAPPTPKDTPSLSPSNSASGSLLQSSPEYASFSCLSLSSCLVSPQCFFLSVYLQISRNRLSAKRYFFFGVPFSSPSSPSPTHSSLIISYLHSVSFSLRLEKWTVDFTESMESEKGYSFFGKGLVVSFNAAKQNVQRVAGTGETGSTDGTIF